MDNKKKRFPIFYCIYFVCVAAVVVLIHLAMGTVTKILAEYEAAQPQYEAEKVFETYYANGDYSALSALCDVPVTQFETKDAAVHYLTKFTEGKKITYSAITTGLDTATKYIVKADDVKFSSFTLSPSDKKTERGFTLYEASDFELYCAGPQSVSITAPRGYPVSVNGVALDETALTGTEIRDKSCDFMPDGVEGIVFVEYAVSGLYEPPVSVTVHTPDGRVCPVETAADGVFRADFIYSDSLRDEHSAYVIEAAQTISAFMQNDGKFSAAAAYIDPESELYDYIRNTETWFVIDHNSYGFEDVLATEFYPYDADTFSCRISFTHVLKRTWSKDYRDYIDITYFFRRVGDKFLIYDRYNH